MTRAKEALERPRLPAAHTEISESFRRARSSISDITADLQRLRRQIPSAVKRPRQPGKSK